MEGRPPPKTRPSLGFSFDLSGSPPAESLACGTAANTAVTGSNTGGVGSLIGPARGGIGKRGRGLTNQFETHSTPP